MYTVSSKPPAAFWAVLKVLLCLITAVITLFPGLTVPVVIVFPPASLLHQSQIIRSYIRLLPVKQRFTHLGVQLVDGPAAGHLNIKPFIPFKQRNEEKTEIRISHDHLVTPISFAKVTYNSLDIIQNLLSLADSTYKYHLYFSYSVCKFCSYRNLLDFLQKVRAGFRRPATIPYNLYHTRPIRQSFRESIVHPSGLFPP